jgi:hypothetical protein
MSIAILVLFLIVASPLVSAGVLLSTVRALGANKPTYGLALASTVVGGLSGTVVSLLLAFGFGVGGAPGALVSLAIGTFITSVLFRLSLIRSLVAELAAMIGTSVIVGTVALGVALLLRIPLPWPG